MNVDPSEMAETDGPRLRAHEVEQSGRPDRGNQEA